MRPDFVPFVPQPRANELPPRLPSPFAADGPHALARRAADEVRDALTKGIPYGRDAFDEPQRGKMFGVLVVRDSAGQVGYLRAFSGMLQGSWHVEGFAPPVFDVAHRDSFWPAGETELVALDRACDAIAFEIDQARATLADWEHVQNEQSAARDHTRAQQRRQRQDRRRALGADTANVSTNEAALHALAQESQRDAAEKRAQRQEVSAARLVATAPLLRLQKQHHFAKQQRATRSAALLEQIHAGYQLTSARGERRSLRDTFAPEIPPGGAGDCAAPKLFAHAARHGLQPVAIAEFWWGAPPITGERRHGFYYPACHGKCGPTLAHMLDGLDHDPLPIFGLNAFADSEPQTIFEDEWLVVVAKPAGLLSVPGRNPQLRDSVQTRLQARYPTATGPMLVHRLDLDTSGLLLAAKDYDTYVALQKQFAAHDIEKTYVAVLDGVVAHDEGRVDLPLRVDLADRPRQIHDPIHGKAARTDWRVLSRTDTRTRVAFFPRTGRTHQLRVHAAHPQGLGCPIVGDRLYGLVDARLMLHAESLSFSHPRTGQTIHVKDPCPF